MSKEATMRRHTLILSISLLPACGLAADGPAFNCAQAESEVPKLICNTPELAALDRKLDEVYRAALPKAKKAKDELPAEQRDWVKGRDECSKDRAAMETCVRQNYHERTGELQARYELVPAKGPYTFVCGASPTDEVTVKYFHTEPPIARLERGGRTIMAWSQPAASGAKFVGRDATFWNKGTEARIDWLGAKLTCEVRVPPAAK
jgi:uncharacterized protein